MQFKKSKIIHKINTTFFYLVILLSLCITLCSGFEFSREKFVVIKSRKIFLEIADSPKKQEQGLMHINRLPENFGMIFLFDRAEPRSFWMKNVEIPLDIIFIRKNIIVDIHKNVPVDKENKGSIYETAHKADCVIEVNAGFCDKYDVKPGDKVILSRDIYLRWKRLKYLTAIPVYEF